jgi:hypothetical protein
MSTNVIVGASSFSTGFSLGFESSALDISVINLNITSADVTDLDNSIGDWLECPPYTVNDWFQKDTNCAENERELYDVLQMDAWNSFGVNMTYYVTDYSLNNDVIYGEDNDRTVERGFYTTGFMEQLPKEDRNIPLFGIEGMDLFKIYINKMHFTSASTYSADEPQVYDSYTPQVGDIVFLDHSEIYYEVTHVKDKVEQFLQRPHAWDIAVREYKDFHLSISSTVSATVSASTLSAITDQDDYVKQNDDVDIEKTNVLYTPKTGEEPSQDPFAAW